MKAVNIDAYLGLLQAGGVVRGCDLVELDEERLEGLGVCDELHRQIILECLDELRKGSSSLVSVHVYVYRDACMHVPS